MNIEVAMKKFGIFLLGFICGIAFIFIIGALANNNSGLVLFEKEGKCFHTNKLEVFQAISPGEVLARIGKFPDDTIVFLLDESEKSYYDGEIISVPKNKCPKQIGTFQYETKFGMKTVPAVIIE